MKTFASAIALAACLSAVPALAQEATPALVDAFVTMSEKDLAAEGITAARAEWIYQTYFTGDTEALTAAAGAEVTKLQVAQALQAAKFAPVSGLSADKALSDVVTKASTTAGVASWANAGTAARHAASAMAEAKVFMEATPV